MRMKEVKWHRTEIKVIIALLILGGCAKERSPITGWEYNNPKQGGFEKVPYEEQETGPNLVLIQGGRFTMGQILDDVMYEWNNYQRVITVSSFYMDETEITNFHWLEYLYWLDRVFGADYPQVVKRALPDTLCWRSKLGYNEPYVEYYLRHPAFRDYPVVGVSWVQANDFCSWRTDRVNEYILIREGLFEWNTNQVGEDNFNTDAYLFGQYESGKRVPGIPSLRPGEETRNVKMEDGILLPRYRLPTEAEWEYAAYGLVGNTVGERILERNTWPWKGHSLRNPEEKFRGLFMANFKRGWGDYMGIAGRLNDNADITSPVYAYWPNDYGLYGMGGNVAEWVMDVYRQFTIEDFDDFRGFRGNIFTTWQRDEEGNIAQKDSLGRIPRRLVTVEENVQRRNYKKAYNVNYKDGDYVTQVDQAYWTKTPKEIEDEEKALMQQDTAATTEQKIPETSYMYNYYVYLRPEGLTKSPWSTLVNDRARVVKGSSWKDMPYWVNPGTRRFLDENQSTNWIGFRCAMDRVGAPQGF